eukprot:TRINITY_DN3262_c0_g1_i1.p1 TRINITY_DN3262_c0_g1~~TRINITY_DN3262_c0_g1_i1.p1  ORF type:complete len:379 (-),score=71.35 TRINITY_DN3262_c0_g1_i1:31-1167(-)
MWWNGFTLLKSPSPPSSNTNPCPVAVTSSRKTLYFFRCGVEKGSQTLSSFLQSNSQSHLHSQSQPQPQLQPQQQNPHVYGVSCFRKLQTGDLSERGARMKSVGLLCTSYRQLHKHIQFLREQAEKEVQAVGSSHEMLTKYFQATTNKISDLSSLSLSHPSKTPFRISFGQFISTYGKDVFILWRAMLLKKRILFYSPPPIGQSLHRVYYMANLSQHTCGGTIDIPPPLFFYICLPDIPSLSSPYVGLTSDLIFQENTKRNLYDVFVEEGKVTFAHPILIDRKWDQFLWDKMKKDLSLSEKEDQDLLDWFQGLNDHLFQRLITWERNQKENNIPRRKDVRQLLKIQNLPYFRHLIKLYKFDIQFDVPLDEEDDDDFCCC